MDARFINCEVGLIGSSGCVSLKLFFWSDSSDEVILFLWSNICSYQTNFAQNVEAGPWKMTDNTALFSGDGGGCLQGRCFWRPFVPLNDYRIKTWPCTDLVLLRSRRYWFRKNAEIESFPTTPIPSWTKQYKVDSYTYFDPIVIQRHRHSTAHRTWEFWWWGIHVSIEKTLK